MAKGSGKFKKTESKLFTKGKGGFGKGKNAVKAIGKRGKTPIGKRGKK